ncbi:hypothetical protein KAH55_07015 [bacterium]|nr:hypothetical protein [bacterium]
MNGPLPSKYRMNPRRVTAATPLVANNQSHTAIIYPAANPEYRLLAERLELTIFQTTGVHLKLKSDTAVLPNRDSRLPDTFRQHPLILLGSLNTNRALLPLYAGYYCAADAVYPGEDGHELRTIVNPYGTGANVIFAGGSTLEGVNNAVTRLTTKTKQAGAPGELTLPFLLDIQLSPALQKQLAEWPETPLNAELPNLEDGMKKSLGFNAGLARAIGTYGIMYWWTGDRRYGEFSRDCLRMLNQVMADSYGDWHYRAERILVTLPLLIMGGLLNEADIQRTDELLLGTALGTENMWWRLKDDQPPLGHRHHGQGTYEFYLLARYLRFQTNPNAAVRQLCDRWISECETFLDALSRTGGTDDQDDESGLNNMANIYWYALATEKFDFFESGDARRIAERALALHDNKGAGSGQGGYAESQGGAMYMQQEATGPVAACTFYYQDPQLKWIFENMPNLKIPYRTGFLSFAPPFMHKFDTGPELECEPPKELIGIQRLPITHHQYAINCQPPKNYEALGHLVNAPETWELGEGIDIAYLLRQNGFDKLVFRNGFNTDDAYLLLQGYQGGYRWQGHMQAANCIVRFSQFGHIWLIQNTGQHSAYYKNGVFISDGLNQALRPPLAECLAAEDFPNIGMSITRLAGKRTADWTRHLFWSKASTGFFVVLDAVKTHKTGPLSMTCTWRTPAFAERSDRTWHSVQGKHRFTLTCSERLKMTNETRDAADKQGAANPFVLRQYKAGNFTANEQITFEKLFYVQEIEQSPAMDIRKIWPGEVLISQKNQPFAWCAIAGTDNSITGLGFTTTALSAWLTTSELSFAGMTSFVADNGLRIHTDSPVGLYFDFQNQKLTVSANSAATPKPVSLTIQANNQSQKFILPAGEKVEHELAPDLILALTNNAEALFTAFAAEGGVEPAITAKAMDSHSWQRSYQFNGFSQVPQRIRQVTVSADPQPVDGFPEQLIDTMLPEMREISTQWPDAKKYHFTLNFPCLTEVTHLRLLGDSPQDPFLQSFQQLPKPIQVILHGKKDGENSVQYEVQPEAEEYFYKRYRDMGDSLEMLELPINQPVKQIELTFPMPPAGQHFILNEIEIYGTEMVRPPIRHLITADIDLDGKPEILVVTAANELLVLNPDSTVRWRKQFSKSIAHLSCHDLDVDGRLWLCLGLLGGGVEIWSNDGVLRQSLPLAAEFQHRTDAFFGWFSILNSVNVWYRDADGRAWLVLGGYASLLFLNPDGEIIGHSFADGPWQTDILFAERPDTNARDLWVRSGWNHGLFYYEGQPGTEPSGDTVIFGGVSQPMFRPLRKVIPFVNGKTVTFEWLDPENKTTILAAAENGVGVLDSLKNEWIWKTEGRTPIMACIRCHGRNSGKTKIIIGSEDGFITEMDAQTGTPLRRKHLGAPVIGLVRLNSGHTITVATREGLWAFDQDWTVTAFQSIGLRKMIGMTENSVVVIRDNYSLEIIQLQK